jgi:hypothetical protein
MLLQFPFNIISNIIIAEDPELGYPKMAEQNISHFMIL